MEEKTQSKNENFINHTLFSGLCLSLLCSSIFLLTGYEVFLFVSSVVALLVVLQIILVLLYLVVKFGAFPVMELELNLYLMLLMFVTFFSASSLMFYRSFL